MPRKTLVSWLLLVVALSLGAFIAYVDSRPTWDDTGVTAGVILIVSGMLGLAQPPAWVLALGAGRRPLGAAAALARRARQPRRTNCLGRRLHRRLRWRAGPPDLHRPGALWLNPAHLAHALRRASGGLAEIRAWR